MRPEFGSLHVRIYVILAALSCGLGGVILTGQEQRFSAPTFAQARALVEWWPFAPPWALWGTMFVLYGTALALAFGRPIAVHVVRFGMVPYLFFTITILFSGFADIRASLTGVVAYSTFFALHAVVADHLAHRSWAGC